MLNKNYAKHSFASNTFRTPPRYFWVFIIIIFYLLLLLPSIIYSVMTPFAMVDDFYLAGRPFLNELKLVLKNSFSADIYRFRPAWDLATSLFFQIFGLNPVLYHVIRIVEKYITGILLFTGLSRFLQKRNDTRIITACVFAAFYLFFPNNPEARLAPQETTMLLCFSICILMISNIYTKFDGDLLYSKLQYSILLLAFCGLVFFKETSISYSIPIVIISVLLAFKQNKILAAVPFAIILLYQMCMMIIIGRNFAAVGASHFDINRYFPTIYHSFRMISLAGWSHLFAFIFCIGVPVLGAFLCFKQNFHIPDETHGFKNKLLQAAKQIAYNRFLAFYVYLFCWEALSFIVLVVTSQGPVLRYTQNTLIAVMLTFVYSFSHILHYVYGNKKIKRFFLLATVLFCVWFIAANYYNFLYQYATQYYVRNTEKQVFETIDSLLAKDNTMLRVIGVGEPSVYILRRGKDVLPLYGHKEVGNIREDTISKWDPTLTNYVVIFHYPNNQEKDLGGISNLPIMTFSPQSSGISEKLLQVSLRAANRLNNNLPENSSFQLDAGVHNFRYYSFEITPIGGIKRLYDKEISTGQTLSEALPNLEPGKTYMLEVIPLLDGGDLRVSITGTSIKEMNYTKNLIADNAMNELFYLSADGVPDIDISDTTSDFIVRIFDVN